VERGQSVVRTGSDPQPEPTCPSVSPSHASSRTEADRASPGGRLESPPMGRLPPACPTSAPGAVVGLETTIAPGTVVTPALFNECPVDRQHIQPAPRGRLLDSIQRAPLGRLLTIIQYEGQVASTEPKGLDAIRLRAQSRSGQLVKCRVSDRSSLNDSSPAVCGATPRGPAFRLAGRFLVV